MQRIIMVGHHYQGQQHMGMRLWSSYSLRTALKLIQRIMRVRHHYHGQQHMGVTLSSSYSLSMARILIQRMMRVGHHYQGRQYKDMRLWSSYSVSMVLIDSEDNEGSTPLSRAELNGHGAVVKLLLADHRVNPD
ncbi:hypothetical protein BDV19DRAFT_375170 [Aspergillus venezuelensis]